jgi:N-acetylmuramoyl-L-alanine amidase
MRLIKRIFIHCSAGFGDVESIKRHWKSIGWKSVGYHRIIAEDGEVFQLAPYEQMTNGVKGYNSTSIHICYIGGVDRANVLKAKDSRTEAQKEGLICEIENALLYLKQFQSVDDIQILGHRDISPDKNLNGKIDAWERIKECPSFDAIPEYKHLIEKYK